MTPRAQFWSGSLAALAVVAAAGCLTADTMAMGGKLGHSTRTVERRLVGQGPEALLGAILRDIAEDRIAAATEQLDRLLEANPNFRLAQLIKGDLLMARARPIAALGNAPDAPAERVSDLRDEAKVRLQRLQSPGPGDRVPRFLLKMAPEQKHAVVVDTARATLYLFENGPDGPRYVSDYYITIGKNGTDKLREGDKKTPLGVYHVTGNLPRNKVGDFYGSGAYPISYPNEWDRRNGRDGHGIWLHGTPRDTYSRPPRASDGCVVLTNPDLTTIAANLQIGITPVIIADDIDWVSRSELSDARADLESAVERWRRDWESLQTDNYISHYAPSFSSGTQGLAEWAAQKRTVNSGKEWVKVRMGDVSMFLYPGRQPLAVVTFTQDYRSNNLSNVMRKRTYWMRDGDRWKIVYEGAA
jgi:murein L,D-transpeptidase YafK